MKYKVSNYNYIINNQDGDYLLYNTLNGRRSFLKVKKQDKAKIQALMDCNSEFDVGMVEKKLIDKGYVIPENYDEESKIKEIFEQKLEERVLNLIIAPTGKCNLRCVYCCEDFEGYKMSIDTQDSIINYVDKNIDSYSGVNVDWFGGEPLLAVDVIEHIATRLIAICKEHRKPYTSFITTNGTLLDLQTFEKLCKLKIVMYQITIDGTKSVHDKQRVGQDGTPTFDTIMNNLRSIRDSKIGRHTIIMILTNYSKVLKDEVHEYKEYFAEVFGGDRRFCFNCNIIMNLGGGRIKEYISKVDDFEGINRFYESIIQDPIKLPFVYEEFLEPGSQLCYAAKKNSYLIAEDGRLYKCEHIYQTRKDEAIGYLDKYGEMILNGNEEKWLGKFDYCKDNKCRLKPLCLGEDCIKRRVDGIYKGTCSCEFHECHFVKQSVEWILRLLDRERDIFELI